eukprot:360874-Chlamydomonas_euryale.AAC.32
MVDRAHVHRVQRHPPGAAFARRKQQISVVALANLGRLREREWTRTDGGVMLASRCRGAPKAGSKKRPVWNFNLDLPSEFKNNTRQFSMHPAANCVATVLSRLPHGPRLHLRPRYGHTSHGWATDWLVCSFLPAGSTRFGNERTPHEHSRDHSMA